MKKTFLKWVIFISIAFPLFFGCGGKGKEVKTIKGDPEVLYKQGLARFNKRDYTEALKIFEQIKASFPDSPPYTIWSELKVGDCHFFKKEYVEAIAAYEEFKKIHPTHEEMPYVQYQIGMSYFHQMRTLDRDQASTKKALSNFEYLVANSPPNIFREKAEGKISICKKQLADHEFYIGNFYYKHGKFQASVSRFEGLLEQFPKNPKEDKTLYLLGKSYLEIDQWEKARATFAKIVDGYPKSSYYKEAKTILDQGRREKKASLSKTKAKEAKKRGETAETELEKVALVKFDEERRQPVPLEEKKVALKGELVKPTPPAGDTQKIVTPLPKFEEEGRRSVAPITPPQSPESKGIVSPLDEGHVQEEQTRAISSPPPSKAMPRVEVKPEDEKRIAALPFPPMAPELKEVPREKEEKRIASLPPTEPKEKEVPKKRVLLEPGEGKLVDSGQPIDITSDRVETYSKENLIIFKGNVMARQKDMVIYSDSLEAVVFEDGKGIEKVIAGGNVKIQQGLRVANCQKAVFYNLDQKVILTGDPKVWEGNNMVSGDEIVFDIEQNRVEVKGGPSGRGKAKIHPGGEFETAQPGRGEQEEESHSKYSGTNGERR